MNEQHIIAEFMGLTHEEKTITAPHGSGNDITYTVYYDDSREVYLKYNTSWDSLIPVVSKLFKMFFELGYAYDDNEDIDKDISYSLDEKFELINELIFMNKIKDCFKIVVEIVEIFNNVKK